MKPLGAKKIKGIAYGPDDQPVDWVGADKSGRTKAKEDTKKEVTETIEEIVT
jgi:hypothetical protein